MQNQSYTMNPNKDHESLCYLCKEKLGPWVAKNIEPDGKKFCSMKCISTYYDKKQKVS